MRRMFAGFLLSVIAPVVANGEPEIVAPEKVAPGEVFAVEVKSPSPVSVSWMMIAPVGKEFRQYPDHIVVGAGCQPITIDVMCSIVDFDAKEQWLKRVLVQVGEEPPPPPPPPPELALTLPQSVPEGSLVHAEVSHTGAEVAQVSLASSSARATVPPAVDTPPGKFNVMAPQNDQVDGDEVVTITATLGTAVVTADIVVVDDDEEDTPPPGKRLVTVVYESEANTPDFVLTTQGLQKYCRDKGHQYLLIDKDTVNPDGATPSWLTAYLNLIREEGVELPAMVVVAQHNGDTIARVEPLPATADKAIELLQELGG